MTVVLLLARPPVWNLHAEEHDALSGLWESYDDHTGKASGVVRIYAERGKFFGRIEKSFTSGDDIAVCNACTDERKGQPIIGLVVIRNVKKEGESYVGGDILDPDSGTVYRCKMQLENAGSQLVVRAFVGVSLFGRSQTWQRVK
jgi:uncharacterized protein (DUF2147 family)